MTVSPPEWCVYFSRFGYSCIGLYQVYLLCGGGGGGAHVGQWNAVNQVQNVLDLLVRDLNVQEWQLP